MKIAPIHDVPQFKEEWNNPRYTLYRRFALNSVDIKILIDLVKDHVSDNGYNRLLKKRLKAILFSMFVRANSKEMSFSKYGIFGLLIYLWLNFIQRPLQRSFNTKAFRSQLYGMQLLSLIAIENRKFSSSCNSYPQGNQWDDPRYTLFRNFIFTSSADIELLIHLVKAHCRDKGNSGITKARLLHILREMHSELLTKFYLKRSNPKTWYFIFWFKHYRDTFNRLLNTKSFRLDLELCIISKEVANNLAAKNQLNV